jgi:NADP-dependent 3-hydroxy acid dehydrogenase YdfG
VQNRAQNIFKQKMDGTAVVTGGGSGIGTMMACAYVQNGAKVYIASRKEEQLKEVGLVHPHSWYHILTNDVPLQIKGLRKAEQNWPWLL